MKLYDVLDTIAWGEKHFGGIMTGGSLRRRDIMRAVERGYAVSQGMASVCDGDGFIIHPERYREAFGLTEAGRAKLAEFEAATNVFAASHAGEQKQ